MSEPERLDIDHLRGWIGREEVASEVLTPEKVRQFRATFDAAPGAPQPGEAAPRLIHWCLAQPVALMSALGPDGHPARGGFLPPVPLPRRMWAGGHLDFHDDVRVGDVVQRASRIESVEVKEGRTGTLCFVTVLHRISAEGRPLLTERQDIVYRGLDGAPAKAAPEPAPAGAHVREVDASAPLLFRYSALTFNGHRIHYDYPYVTQVEGYPGLIVHGPLQATLLLRHAAEIHGAPPARFSFRGLSPLFDNAPVLLNADATEVGLKLWTSRPSGPFGMMAEAGW
ncbi:FAS1-like dehydratase domain-containing protein [Aquabacter cavernae]|uniref:FAS1-like dehydratase domain-containing protein n=1 Tax=Aquabacter cavernae TaxID=2496029 RepID=UPI000F8D291D|nr:MaoC family dehydratase N-terminal domain-containing protein [Aquabacter cavernae]